MFVSSVQLRINFQTFGKYRLQDLKLENSQFAIETGALSLTQTNHFLNHTAVIACDSSEII